MWKRLVFGQQQTRLVRPQPQLPDIKIIMSQNWRCAYASRQLLKEHETSGEIMRKFVVRILSILGYLASLPSARREMKAGNEIKASTA
jgi:hypothetical protein